jgi:hypothetical protein
MIVARLSFTLKRTEAKPILELSLLELIVRLSTPEPVQVLLPSSRLTSFVAKFCSNHPDPSCSQGTAMKVGCSRHAQSSSFSMYLLSSGSRVRILPSAPKIKPSPPDQPVVTRPARPVFRDRPPARLGDGLALMIHAGGWLAWIFHGGDRVGPLIIVPSF